MSTAPTPGAYNLRPFTPDDYPAFIDLGMLAFGEDVPMNVETVRKLDETRDTTRPWGRLLATDAGGGEGTVQGMAVWGQPHGARHFTFWLVVRPERRRRGLGSTLYAAVLEAIAPYRPPALQTTTREDRPATLSFLEQRGFVEVMRTQGNHLTLADFQAERFTTVEESLRAQNIVIRTFTEIDEAEPGARHRLYALTNALWQDVPSPDPFVPLPFDHWQRRLVEDPRFLPDGYFIAVDQASGEFVGVSTLSRLVDSDHLQNDLTGVRRDYRRRGIALALKVRAARYALSVGAPVIRTGNATTNAAMLALNQRLGYQKQPSRIRFIRHLHEQAEIA